MLAYPGEVTPTERNAVQPVEILKKACEAAPDLDVLMAPEWFLRGPAQLQDPFDFPALVSEIRDATRNHPALVVPGSAAWNDGEGRYRNTAPVFHEGKVLLEYEKRSDGDDTELGEPAGLRYEVGDTSGRFEWNGLNVGLEICRDHSVGTLRQESAAPLDVQLVVSAGVWSKSDSSVVRPGGALLNAEGSFWGPQAWQRKPGEDKVNFEIYEEHEPGPKKVELVPGVELHLFDVGSET